jgi:hypothetical protein
MKLIVSAQLDGVWVCKRSLDYFVSVSLSEYSIVQRRFTILNDALFFI